MNDLALVWETRKTTGMYVAVDIYGSQGISIMFKPSLFKIYTLLTNKFLLDIIDLQKKNNKVYYAKKKI